MPITAEKAGPMAGFDIKQLINQRLDLTLPGKLAEINANKTPSMAIIATKGTLDWGLPAIYLGLRGGRPGLGMETNKQLKEASWVF